MVIYVFQCYSLKSSHPRLSPVRIYTDTFKNKTKTKLGANESHYSLRGQGNEANELGESNNLTSEIS